MTVHRHLPTWLAPPWLGRDLWIVLAARLVMSAAQAVAGVVTVLYLTAEGFSGVQVGALLVCVTVMSAVLSSTIGMLSDRLGRRPFLVALPLVTAAAAGLFAFVGTPAALFCGATLAGLGRGSGAGGGANIGAYLPAESAYVGERIPAAARSAAFGRMAFCSSLGALLGSPIASLAGDTHGLTGGAATTAYRPAFLALGALAAVAGLLALALREDRPPAGHGTAGRDAAGRVRRRRPRFPSRSWPALWRLWTTNGINGVAVGMIGPFLSYWLARRYGADAGTIGWLFAMINACALVSALASPWVGRRLGTVRAIVATRALSGLLLVPMALAPTLWLAGAVFLVRMLIQRVGMPLRQSFVQDLAHPTERASVTALSRVPGQATQAGSQALAGYLFQEVSLSAPFEVAAACQCVNALVYAVLFRPGQVPEHGAVDPVPPRVQAP